MAFNPSPKVADCRHIARKWNRPMVVIISFSPDGQYEWASYGESKQLCGAAKELAEVAERAILSYLSGGELPTLPPREEMEP